VSLLRPANGLKMPYQWEACPLKMRGKSPRGV
jgi:hypothetical protein